MGKIAEMARRVKARMSWDEYRALDKNVRVMPEGEVVPAHDVDGREIPDPVPIAPPIGWFKQPSMFDHVRAMVRSEQMRMYAESQGAETFDDASDFDVPDDMFPVSAFEADDDFEPPVDFEARREAMYRERFWAENDMAGYDEWVAEAQKAGKLPPSRKSASAPAEPARPSSPQPAPGKDPGSSAPT